MKREILDTLLTAWDQKRDAVLITDLHSGEQQVLHPHSGGLEAVSPELAEAARAVLRDDSSTTFAHAERTLFLQPHNPPLRLVIVGAVHVAQPLAVMAAVAGWDVVVVDPREAWATAERFPGVRLVGEWPDAALSALAPDRRTAVVTLTHDPKLDDPALMVALRSPAMYIGALGSRLAAAGLTDDQLARIHAPIGLVIGARTPAEIALAILAQITHVLRGGD
jgi:xanthine dehydrogenase accessory factor